MYPMRIEKDFSQLILRWIKTLLVVYHFSPIENKKIILFDILIQQPRVGSCLDNTHIFTIYGHEDKRGIGTYSVP